MHVLLFTLVSLGKLRTKKKPKFLLASTVIDFQQICHYFSSLTLQEHLDEPGDRNFPEDGELDEPDNEKGKEVVNASWIKYCLNHIKLAIRHEEAK